MIDLYSYPTSNGQKVMLMLEETGLPWQHHDINIRLGDQFRPEHLQRSPNNKIPAIIDSDGPGGAPYTMMESNAILFYLAEKTGRFLPADPRGRYDTLQWLIFQSAHLGPMMGQANHFNNHTDVQYGKDRYNQEVARLLRVVDNRLREHAFIAGVDYTIADMAIYPWCRNRKGLAMDEASHPGFFRWLKAIEERPAVQRCNELSRVIRERMDQTAATAAPEQRISLYDTRDNLNRLASATLK